MAKRCIKSAISAPLYICHTPKPSYSFAIACVSMCSKKATLTSKHPDTAYYSLFNSSIQRHRHQPFYFPFLTNCRCVFCARGKTKRFKEWPSTQQYGYELATATRAVVLAALFPRRMDAPVQPTGLQWHRGQKRWGQVKSRVSNPGQNHAAIALTGQFRSSVLAFPSTTDGSYKNTVYPQHGKKLWLFFRFWGIWLPKDRYVLCCKTAW